MGRVVRPAAWVLLFAAIGAAAASWFTPTPDVDAGDAAELAVDALADAGVRARPSARPQAAEHATDSGEKVEVWIVPLETRVEGRTEKIELRVQRSAGRLVYVDDRIGEADADRLLTDRQFAVLADHRDDTLANRWTVRNGLGGVSAAVIAGACYVLATRSEQIEDRR
jgi:hypothetical protein